MQESPKNHLNLSLVVVCFCAMLGQGEAKDRVKKKGWLCWEIWN